MMIANWMNDSVKPQVVITRLFLSLETSSHDAKLAGEIRRVMPRSATVRSRKGMKGGEH
jgi:hypothetical protein